MPIPGPSPTDALDSALPTGSPFWLSISGNWYLVEGVTPSTPIATDRPVSELVTIDGNRYSQRAPKGMRQWDLAFTYADTATLAALRVAAELDTDVWLMSDAVSGRNMLPPRSCFGSNVPALDCGGIGLPYFTPGDVVTGRVRGGASTTFSAFTDASGAGEDLVSLVYPGGTATLLGTTALPSFVTFTPATDGDVTATILPAAGSPVAGLMLTEGTAPAAWIPGENMPCKVAVADPDDTLTMHHGGAWRHDYSVVLREVG